MDVTTFDTLPPARSADVLALAIRASTHDGVKPLSEQGVLDLRRLPGESIPKATTHLVIFDTPGEINAHILGYAHVDHESDPSFELVVHPDHRRRGLGTDLLEHILARWPGARGWAHGNTSAAQGLAQAAGMTNVRELWRMGRALPTSGGEELPAVHTPTGFAIRTFEVGTDEAPWLAVNAAAFAHHPEQGQMTSTDLADRISEAWFDPHGFLLVEDADSRDTEGKPRLAAFHWTKVEPATPGSSRAAAGEVYVVGVDPAYQGRGLGALSTLIGLRHLNACGLRNVTLYVEGDNIPAIATYRRLGFSQSGVDVMYSAAAKVSDH